MGGAVGEEKSSRRAFPVIGIILTNGLPFCGRSRETENMEYVKNVVHHFMCSDSYGREQLLNPIATILHFTPEEVSTSYSFHPLHPPWHTHTHSHPTFGDVGNLKLTVVSVVGIHSLSTRCRFHSKFFQSTINDSLLACGTKSMNNKKIAFEMWRC